VTIADIIHPDSLGDTLDILNSGIFYGLNITPDEKSRVMTWLASRQGLPGSYAGMFAPTAQDYAVGAMTFTGEVVVSRAGIGHLLSEEACRAMNRLGVSENSEINLSLHRARRAILHRLESSGENGIWSGAYCCGYCSVALWRHLSSSGQKEDEFRLENGMMALKRRRDGKGRWKQFPFYYTLLALSEIELPVALNEIIYALPSIERALRKVERSDPEAETEHERRRRIVMGRILQKI